MTRHPRAAAADPLAVVARPETVWAAWARVAAGSGIPGADGISVEEFARALGPRLWLLGDLLRSGNYQAQPLRPVLATRGGRTRQRGIPTVADRIAQRAVLHACADRLLPAASETSFAYQRGRSWLDALQRARAHGAAGLRWVFRTDIAEFFATIDRRLLTEPSLAVSWMPA
ncbi:hypothetical protein M8C13_05005 [Crossiella sp. SN42]|uniref:hypothetical protein n=1 Tax=Crossiella sp. SN42 TaxID=2944808 RepID=UPI00207C17AF|nr:hypothetical protein [Crossiella sp. SN42]MCO1575116.1 hypothetical protein [Crossiella sp. SN42]